MNKTTVIAVSSLILFASVVVGIVVSPAYGAGFGVASGASLAVGAYALRRQHRP